MKILLIALMLFSFSTPAHAITVGKVIDKETGQQLTLIETTNGSMAFADQEKFNIDNLKAHTVIVKQREYQTDGTIKYYTAAGIAIDERHIVTVNHIVYSELKSDNYYFAATGATPYTATVIKTDSKHDIALLEINKNAPDLIAEPMAFAKDITAGETIYTIGHPGKGYDLTVGKIDVKAKGWNNIECYMLEANIQEGNSGGFVINSKGELVGMVFSAAEMLNNIGYMIGKDDIQNFLK